MNSSTEIVDGFSISVCEMKPSTCGTIGIAVKNGKKYFCKRFNSVVEPSDNGMLGPKAIEKNRALFEAFTARKLRVNNTLRMISGEGGNIVFPIVETVHDHHWMEFSELIENAVPDDQYVSTIAALSDREKLLLLKTAIAALQTIHAQKMIHADLKLTNIMLVKTGSGHVASRIIDFDGAFFEDDVPLDSITGTPDYYSPELAIYTNCEDPEKRMKLRGILTTKSDIYTMGLIFHEYLTGEKPQPAALSPSLRKLKKTRSVIYPWQVSLANDKDSPRTQLRISDCISEPEYAALIADMIHPDPNRRPSASEVLLRLNNHSLPISAETWPDDHIVIDAGKAAGTVIGLCRLERREKDKPPIQGYEIMERDGTRQFKTAEDLVCSGLARKAELWEAPWPEDGIELNLDRVKSVFSSFRRGIRPGVYELTSSGGMSRVMTRQTLLLMRFAQDTRKADAKPSAPVPAGAAVIKAEEGLWPEDDAALKVDEAMLGRFRMKLHGRAVFRSVQGYLLQMMDGQDQFWTSQKCRMMRILVPK